MWKEWDRRNSVHLWPVWLTADVCRGGGSVPAYLSTFEQAVHGLLPRDGLWVGFSPEMSCVCCVGGDRAHAISEDGKIANSHEGKKVKEPSRENLGHDPWIHGNKWERGIFKEQRKWLTGELAHFEENCKKICFLWWNLWLHRIRILWKLPKNQDQVIYGWRTKGIHFIKT